MPSDPVLISTGLRRIKPEPCGRFFRERTRRARWRGEEELQIGRVASRQALALAMERVKWGQIMQWKPRKDENPREGHRGKLGLRLREIFHQIVTPANFLQYPFQGYLLWVCIRVHSRLIQRVTA